MTNRYPDLALAALAIGAAAPGLAADVTPAMDLKATIVLHGMPCDEVANSQRLGDSDYLATCKNGNRYHVYVDASGRVVVEKK